MGKKLDCSQLLIGHWQEWTRLSSAYNKGVSLNDILKAGDWADKDTFLRYYYVHAFDTPVGQIILYESTLTG